MQGMSQLVRHDRYTKCSSRKLRTFKEIPTWHETIPIQASSDPQGVFMPVLLGLLAASPVNAAIFRVGAGGAAGGCTHSTLQAAVDAASVSPGADIILVARNQTWTAQELLVDTSQELTIEGGYENCNSNTPSGSTELSGQGGNARPVIRIYGRNGSIIRLRRLTITRGDNGTGGDGAACTTRAMAAWRSATVRSPRMSPATAPACICGAPARMRGWILGKG